MRLVSNIDDLTRFCMIRAIPSTIRGKIPSRTMLYSLAATVLLTIAGTASADEAQWSFSTEFGFGIRHNHGGGLLLWRGRFGDNDDGCGFVIGGWSGRWHNRVAGLTCAKRVLPGMLGKHHVTASLGGVAIRRSRIVNSSWAYEFHLRYLLSPRTAISYTHYSNAGTREPNRGFNFLSLEFQL
jgi:hypothetical protein